jgi:transposase
MSTENKQKRPKYTLEFKKDAAKLVIEKDYTQEQAANNLGISKSALSRWVRAERVPTKNNKLSKFVQDANCIFPPSVYDIWFLHIS